MISIGQLERLFRDLDGSQTHTGSITVKRALDLLESVKRGGAIYYRVDVAFLSIHSEHHYSWTTIFVDITKEGIRLMTQRSSSCPGCTGAACDEVDARPVKLDNDEEWELFVKWGHVIVVSEDVLKLLKAGGSYPFKKYPLAVSEADLTLYQLPPHLRELFETIREVAKILLETKEQFKSGRLATARLHLTWALEKIGLSIGE